MIAFDLILRWMHIFGAIMLVGSTIFMRCVYLPAREFSEDKPQAEFAEWIRKLWARMVMISSGQLLISGIFSVIMLVKQFEISKEAFPGNVYHPILGIKFLIAFVIFFLAAAISGKSGLAQKLRQKEKFWLTVNMVLAITVVCMAGVMRLADRSEKSTSSVPREAMIETVDAGSTTAN